MSRIRGKPLLAGLIAFACVVLISVAVYGAYLASATGQLPWQEDPTRIPVTPFSEIPGFTPPTPLPTATAG